MDIAVVEPQGVRGAAVVVEGRKDGERERWVILVVLHVTKNVVDCVRHGRREPIIVS